MTLTYGRAWTTYDVTSHSDGSASVHIQTTADLVEGARGRDGATLEVDSLEQVLVLTGTSRISAAGVIVTVRLDDGEELIG